MRPAKLTGRRTIAPEPHRDYRRPEQLDVSGAFRDGFPSGLKQYVVAHAGGRSRIIRNGVTDVG